MKHRLFIAINLPAYLKTQIAEIIDKLAKVNRGLPIKWVKSEQLHLTLHFLGYLEQKESLKVQALLNNLSKSYHPCQLKCGQLAAFPNLNRPRVLMIKLQELGGNEIISFQQELGSGLEKLGLEVDHRPWQPHVTLGRIKEYGVKPKLPSVSLPEEVFEVKSVELMESVLSRQGPMYSVVGSFGFSV